MNIAVATLGLLVAAYLIDITQSNLTLQIFYASVAVTVFIMGCRAKSNAFLFLGGLLFARFFLENYQYAWSPIGQLGFGHFIIALAAYLVVKTDEDKFLLYFPALILLQGIADISYLVAGYDYYPYIHNALALMQMSAFVVLARSRRKHPVIKDDPIEELISRLLTRSWASGLLAWKSTDGA